MCLFCKIINKDIPASIVYEDDHVLAILDISQATKGHTLVMPKIHVETMLECPEDTLNQVMVTTQQLSKQITKRLNAKGANILTNIHQVAGQTIQHFHVHILPRYDDSDGIEIKMKHNSNIDFIEVLQQIKTSQT